MFCSLLVLFCYLPSIRILPKQRTWGATAALGAACLAGLSVETASWSVVKMNPSDVCFRAKEQLAISLEHQQRVGCPFFRRFVKSETFAETKKQFHEPWTSPGLEAENSAAAASGHAASLLATEVSGLFTFSQTRISLWPLMVERTRLVWRNMSNLWPR